MTSAASDPEASREEGPPRAPSARGRALVPVRVAAPKAGMFAGLGRSHGIVAGGVAVVMGLGFVAGTAVFASKPQAVVVAQAASAPDTTMDVLYRVQGEVRSLRSGLDALRASSEEGRQADTIRALKKSVDVLRGDLDGVKAASAGAVGQLGAKIDRLDHDPGPKLNEIVARLDKLDRDPDKVAQATQQLAARLDRVERQVASADATGSIPTGATASGQAGNTAVKAPLPPARAMQPSPTGPAAVPVAAVPPPRPEAPAKAEAPKADPARAEQARIDAVPHPEAPHQEANNRPATVDGWLLRDVYDGVALVEGRAGGLREVSPGDRVPGVGEVRSIERRGRGWVVVTSRGIIQADNRW